MVFIFSTGWLSAYAAVIRLLFLMKEWPAAWILFLMFNCTCATMIESWFVLYVQKERESYFQVT